MGRIEATPFVAAAVIVLAVVAACGGGGPPPAPTATPFVAQATFGPGGCSFIGLNQPKTLLWPTLYLGKSSGALVRFHEDEPVPISFQVESCGTESVRVVYPSSQRYEIAVEDDEGNEVWRWSLDKLFAQQVSEEELESVTYFEEWDRRDNDGNALPDGRYEITAWLTGEVEEGAQVRGCGVSDADCAIEASQIIALSP
jgi:hypothetical protein